MGKTLLHGIGVWCFRTLFFCYFAILRLTGSTCMGGVYESLSYVCLL